MSHTVILVPGLGDETRILSLFTRNWEHKYGLAIKTHKMHWYDKSITFEKSLSSLLNMIDEERKRCNKLSLVGTSAGASAVINAYCERKQKILSVVNICGRVRRGINVFPSLELASRRSRSFYESVIRCEENTEKMNMLDRKKILNLRPIYDELVPASCAFVVGSKNITIPSAIHMITISLCLTLFSRKIVNHITQESN